MSGIGDRNQEVLITLKLVADQGNAAIASVADLSAGKPRVAVFCSHPRRVSLSDVRLWTLDFGLKT